MSQNKDIIPHADLIRAVLDGQTVEYKPTNDDNWYAFGDAASAISGLANYPHWQYRIKPKPETKEQALEALRKIVKGVIYTNEDEDILRRFIEEAP